MSMKESSFEPGETLYAGAFEIDGIQVIFAAKMRAQIALIALKIGMNPGTIDIRKFKSVKVVETDKDTNTMMWIKKTPTTPGWYWMRKQSSKHDNPQIVYIRDYAGELAMGNSHLRGWHDIESLEWAGPISLPEEEPVKVVEI